MQKIFRPDPPLVLGVVGGIASGKSTVAAMIAEHGLVHLDADAEARRVIATPEISTRVRERFGDAVFEPGSDRLDRAALAQIVFADRASLQSLEAITHPAVRRALLEGIEAARRSGRSVVLDAPLLVEGGLVEVCDECIFVAADLPARRARARLRNWSDDELERREANQAALDVKSSRCRYRVSTAGSLGDTREQIVQALAQIAAAHARG